MQKSLMVVCLNVTATAFQTSSIPSEATIKPSQTVVEAERREKRYRFEHTRHVVHYGEAYVNTEKDEELYQLSVIDAWEQSSSKR